MCGLGLPIPEDIILLFMGYLSFQGDIQLLGSNLVSLIGVLAGDLVIYYLGKRYGYNLLANRFFCKVFTTQRIEKVRHAFNRNGNLYLFLARFAPGIRSVTFWMSGMFRIPMMKFLLYDGTAALLSVPLFVYAGFKFGEAFHLLVGRVKITSLILGGVILIVFIVSFLKYYREKPITVPQLRIEKRMEAEEPIEQEKR